MMKLSEKIRNLLSTWMAGYAQPLVEECAEEAAQLEETIDALIAVYNLTQRDVENALKKWAEKQE